MTAILIMANVRGFEGRGHPIGNNAGDNTIIADRGLMDFDEAPTKDPRKENYFEMLKLNLCPKLYWHSFCTLICLLDIIVFGVQLYFDPLDRQGKFLQFLPTGRVINGFGRMDKPLREDKQVYRLVTSLFLHAYFNHIFNNVVSTLIWGSLVEKLVGKWRTAVIYILSGKTIFSLLSS
jgi:rhomboid protease GluP